ncbi:PCP degradation transcriptional activation protein [Zhongshania aliphaticivorans]|uniref:PCP degradation transcriptional activation protein n=1 Tax=Zhongshania aliphaticivorans TaxID=1470434 RepID=A0A5S9P2Z4_9GAMM|nr:LysR family transcriptional regulator [Zhongshania aliphaticivorans]CAA0090229.1 PCP degradation transcriptional activation protein [Zhongshania aliphaticivorans]CAA0097623.1 PCP degradation transcriptional activation protein [Zhongshania aliphaticivorans]
MANTKIDLNLFTVFDAIYSQQSLTRAAGVLHVSQPAVSSSLAKLRSIFDDPLFVRTSAGMTPTPLARQLVTTVRDSLKNLNDCVASRIPFNPATAKRTFRIHATENAELILLPALLKQLKQRAPEITLEVIFSDRRKVAYEMASGHVHLAVDAPLLSHPELISLPLQTDDHICVMRPDHPLARTCLGIDDFLQQEHIHVSSRTKGAGHVDLALRSIGYTRKIVLRLQHFTALPPLLAQSNYIAAVPAGVTHQWPLHKQALPFATPKLELQVFWHKSVEHDPAILWLRELTMEVARQS